MERVTSIFDLVRGQVAFQHRSATVGIDYEPDISTVERYVGSLRAAGFQDTLKTVSEVEAARRVLDNLLKRSSKVRVGSTTIAKPDTTHDTFMSIDALIDKGNCPRCKTSMVPVKLSSKLNANYCQGCRTCVWMRDKK